MTPRRKERRKKSKPLIWNIDIRAHYERFLKICHETTGLLRGTPWAYKKDWNDKERRSFFCDTYCKRFPPYSVLVHNFPISEDAGHTPQNLLAEYIDASRRSQRKRKRGDSDRRLLDLADHAGPSSPRAARSQSSLAANYLSLV